MENEAALKRALTALKKYHLARMIEFREMFAKLVRLEEKMCLKTSGEWSARAMLSHYSTWIDVLEEREELNEDVRECLAEITRGMPLYIKDLLAHREPDGIVIFFSLGDMCGREVKWGGTTVILIGDENRRFVPYSESSTVKETDFERTTVAEASLGRKLVSPVARIPCEMLTWNPKRGETGKVSLIFHPDGLFGLMLQLRAETTVKF